MDEQARLEVTENTDSDGAADAVRTAELWSKSHLQTHEQFFSPIHIQKDREPQSTLPGFRPPAAQGGEQGIYERGAVGPTIGELDPYFSRTLNNTSEFIGKTDFRGMVHDTTGGIPSDLNIKKSTSDTDSITEVRINALRGPLILSGWGYGIDDMPVPAESDTKQYPDKVRHHEDVASDRRKWKTGPVNLMWDDERQVWQGGYHMVYGLATSAIEAPKSPCKPTSFTIKLFRNTGPDSSASPDFIGDITTALGEELRINNRDISLEQPFIANAVFVIAVKLNYEWLPIWVGCPDEGPNNTECIATEIFTT